MNGFKKHGVYENNRVLYILVDQIIANPAQPRKLFEPESLSELADSISRYGVIQPLSVRKRNAQYELIAGERRWRAAKIAGLREVPCILMGVDNVGSSTIALIENLQRKDLDFIEEAEGIAKLINTFGLSQEEAAKKIGKSQPAVANKLRILKHSAEILDLLRKYNLTERHARALLRIERENEKNEILQIIAQKALNVAQTEELIEQHLSKEGQETAQKGRTYIIKDIRIFINTVLHAVNIMRQSGVKAGCDREEDEEEIRMMIRIPKKKG